MEFKKYLVRAMIDSGKAIAKELKQQVDEDVYNTYQNPTHYERTYELRESIDSFSPEKKNGYITVEVGHDYSKIHAKEPNMHMSVTNGQDVSEQLPQWINDGTIGDIFGEGGWTKPRSYMDNMKQKIRSENMFTNELKKQLKNQGIKTD